MPPEEPAPYKFCVTALLLILILSLSNAFFIVYVAGTSTPGIVLASMATGAIFIFTWMKYDRTLVNFVFDRPTPPNEHNPGCPSFPFNPDVQYPE